MDGEDKKISELYEGLAGAVKSETDSRLANIGAAAAAKGPSLGQMNTGGSGIGEYNYNRIVAPTANQIQSNLVAQAKQEAFAETINDAYESAKAQYDKARESYKSRMRQRAAQAARARYSSSGGGSYGSSAAPSGGGATNVSSGVPSNGGKSLEVVTVDGKYGFRRNDKGEIIGYDSPRQSSSSDLFDSTEDWARHIAEHTGESYDDVLKLVKGK